MECTHFYCASCIRDFLNTMLEEGVSPVVCPGCHDNAPAGQAPEGGRVEGKALTFLERHGVIDKALQFRLMRLQTREEEELFFQCPAPGCSELLVQTKPQLTLHGSKVVVRIDRCPCGAAVCVGCHQVVADGETTQHECPVASADTSGDAASLLLMQSIGKKCPRCRMYVMKNGGCDYMMCGTRAHGKLADAIRNGGCGHCFSWKTGKPAPTFFINLEGAKVTGDAAAMYPAEIAALRAELGIVVP